MLKEYRHIMGTTGLQLRLNPQIENAYYGPVCCELVVWMWCSWIPMTIQILITATYPCIFPGFLVINRSLGITSSLHEKVSRETAS